MGTQGMVEAHLRDDLKEYIDPDILAKVPRETIHRLPQIVELLGTMSQKKMAKEMDISYWTLIQDLKYLKETGWYDSFILGNFMDADQKLPDTDEGKLVRFREFGKLVGKLITAKPDKKIGIHIGEQDGTKQVRILAEHRDIIIQLASPESFRRLAGNEHTVKSMDTSDASEETD